MKEISVLEYLKLVFRNGGNWRKTLQILYNSEEKKGRGTSPVKDEASSAPINIVLALVFAILAQIQVEPPNKNTYFAIFFYCLAGVLFLKAVKCPRVETIPHRKNNSNQGVRLVPFILSLVLSVFAFWAFKDNKFNLLNASLWGGAIVLFLYSIWIKEKIKINMAFRIDPWMIVFFFIICVVLFFRLFSINSVPNEMFSDHAEKLLDILDVLNGKTPIFFLRNTGREGFQFYLTSLIIKIFGTGISFTSLKIGTVLCGLLTLPFIFLIGKEIGNRTIGILAFLMAGVAYWPNVISRIGLRFTLYPLFVAPTLYFLILGLRKNSRNDFVLSGLFLGIGLHGYSPIRILPFVIVTGALLAILHSKDSESRRQIIWNILILAFTALIIFLPLFRYAVENPTMFSIRTLTRLTSIEKSISGPLWLVFIKNLWNAMIMFFYSNGEIWVHSVPLRPALDVVTAVFFFLGLIYLVKRYLIHRNWVDLFILVSIPLLMLPSILSLAFPSENPSLNRTAGAIVSVFVISALGMFQSIHQLRKPLKTKAIRSGFMMICGVLILFICISNYKIVFIDYKQQYMQNAWNTSEIGLVIKNFIKEGGNPNNAFVVPYPHWVDTRLVGINAGYPSKDYALWPEGFASTLKNKSRKLFIINLNDNNALSQLLKIYPESTRQVFVSKQPDKNFILLFTSE